MNFSTGKFVRLGGLIVAVISFTVTRIFVAEAVQFQSASSYFLGGLIPLIIGLTVTIYGVVLSVGNFRRVFVNTIAWWTVLGLLGAGLILTVTFIDSVLRGESLQQLSNSQLLVANVLLGGTVSGIVVGTRSARNQRQRRMIKHQANQSQIQTRLLRHEVLNAITVIKGHAQLLTDSKIEATESSSVIENATERIGEAIETIDRLNRQPDVAERVDLDAVIEQQIAIAEQRFPTVSFEYNQSAKPIEAAVDDRIEIVLQELLAHVSEDPSTDHVSVSVSRQSYHVNLTVASNGEELSDKQSELLMSGEFPEFDDPSTDFGLPIVRLIVRQYDGEIEALTDQQSTGNEITISLPRQANEEVSEESISLSAEQILHGSVAGVLAGVVMGTVFALTADVLPVIGALYGTRDPAIGWVTHLFHSVMFALIFVAIARHPAVQESVYTTGRFGMAGLVWGTVLWLVAAGLIMPLWLQVVGVPSPFPNLPRIGFISHALWGSVLGTSYGLLRTLYSA
ncbi:MAG: sensor histidine kinase [Halobacteriales archaeon]